MYSIQIDHITYTGYNDGRGFTLAECWGELDGVGNARILDNKGRTVLNHAGGSTTRREIVRRMYGQMKIKSVKG